MPNSQIDEVDWNGAVSVKAGDLKTDFLKANNNVIKLSRDVMISINKAPFVMFFKGHKILITDTHSYVFKEDMTMSEGEYPASNNP